MAQSAFRPNTLGGVQEKDSRHVNKRFRRLRKR
jgi:hypothetical protein